MVMHRRSVSTTNFAQSNPNRNAVPSIHSDPSRPHPMPARTGTGGRLRYEPRAPASLRNAKPEDRKDTVQLIDATKLGAKLRKSIGSKRMEISDAHRDAIVRAFTGTLSEDDVEVPVKTFHKRDFAYWTVTVERPLQLRFQCTSEEISLMKRAHLPAMRRLMYGTATVVQAQSAFVDLESEKPPVHSLTNLRS
jgi:hypothetical protein